MITTDSIMLTLSNLEMEQALIASALSYPENIRLVDLDPGDLHDKRHQIIWTTMHEMDARNEPVNMETIVNRLTDKKQIDLMGGFVYMMEVYNRSLPGQYPEDFSAPLAELSIRRRAVKEAQEFGRASMDRGRPINDTINTFAARIPKLVKVSKGAQHISEFASRHYDLMNEAINNPEEAALRIMRTGMLEFDDATLGGLRRGEAMLVIGKPGLGKTKWMHKMAYGLACNGYPGVVFQLETSQDEIMDRELSRVAEIPTEHLEMATLNDDELDKYTGAVNTLSNPNLPLYMLFGGSWNTTTIRAELTRLKAEHGIMWFGLDYLRFVRDQHGKDETERENFISANLKHICNDLELAGIIIHGMNKAGIASDAPELEHSGGGAGISYDCDKALFMMEHVPEKGPVYPNYRTFIFRKSRRKLARKIFHMEAVTEYPDFKEPATKGQLEQEGRNGKARY